MTTLIRTLVEWETVGDEIRREKAVGLVPTMGALHDGHGALFDEARQRCAITVVSIFVNPLQFDQKPDYDLYPRVLQDDLAFCAERRINYVFAPENEEMFPEPQRVFIDVEEVSEHLCGQHRPGHFRGVATIVMKLFQIVRPQFVFMGEKDYQQLAVVRRVVRDLNIPVLVIGVPTVRERDGLALSSRNRRLTIKERALAPCLYRALLAARDSIARGERDAAGIKERVAHMLLRIPEVKLEYFELVDPQTIQPVGIVETPVRAALAAWIGKTRLIDNVLCEPRAGFRPCPAFPLTDLYHSSARDRLAPEPARCVASSR